MATRVWTVVLAVSLVAIALALRPAPRGAQPNPALLRAFAGLTPDTVATLVIRRGAGAVRRERGAGWDPSTRERLRLLLGARLERAEALAGAAPERYGLDPPTLSVHVAPGDPGRPALELDVGDAAPDGLSHYVTVRPGPRVAKLPSYHIENLLALAEDSVASEAR